VGTLALVHSHGCKELIVDIPDTIVLTGNDDQVFSLFAVKVCDEAERRRDLDKRLMILVVSTHPAP
jgi:hypothetical protein